MCNAWNHPQNCRCGWGGNGHLGKKTAGNPSDNPWLNNLKFTGTSSYVFPNATCPVCNQPVFFYQSPNGGRVFFEELGPPWPKHPCTDNPRFKTPIPIYKFNTETTKSYLWQLDGWVPFIVKEIIAQPPQFKLYNIRGEAYGQELSLYTLNKGLNPKAPFLVKKLDEVRFEVSTVQFFQSSITAREHNFIGYKFATAASKNQKKSNSNRRHYTRRPTPTLLQINPKTTSPKSKSKPEGRDKNEKHETAIMLHPVRNSIRKHSSSTGAIQQAFLAAGFKKNEK